MDQDQLLSTLKTLHEELTQTEQVDAPTLELIKTVTSDIEELLERTEATPTETGEPVAKGLQELLLRFEGKHPRLAAMIEQITEGLASLGI